MSTLAELKRLWSFKPTDGGVIITSYKGNQTEVAAPEKIGKDAVVAIGAGAFCPFARRITPEMKDARRAVTKITLPETVRAIEKGAFWACEALTSVNIPAGVEAIKENTFAECESLETLVIPSSVKAIERRAFFACGALTAVVEKGSYAEEYCIKNKIAFRCR